MKAIITKGPQFEQVEKKVYEYLNKILTQKVNAECKKEGVS